jgi:hypothetical protein
VVSTAMFKMSSFYSQVRDYNAVIIIRKQKKNINEVYGEEKITVGINRRNFMAYQERK